MRFVLCCLFTCYHFFGLPLLNLFSCYIFSYNIRREKGIIRDPKTGEVGRNRKEMRYTELADDMVEKMGRVGQKARKVGDMFYTCMNFLNRGIFNIHVPS